MSKFLDCKKKEIADRLVQKFREQGIGAAYQDPEHDKSTFEGAVKIDCENRVHLCKAAIGPPLGASRLEARQVSQLR